MKRSMTLLVSCLPVHAQGVSAQAVSAQAVSSQPVSAQAVNAQAVSAPPLLPRAAWLLYGHAPAFKKACVGTCRMSDM